MRYFVMKNLACILIGTLLVTVFSDSVFSKNSNCEQTIRDQNSTTYMLRYDADERCEGLNESKLSNDFRLKSFTVGSLKDTSQLSFTISKVVGLPEPNVRILSVTEDNYQLDPSNPMKSIGNQWQFSWPSRILRSRGIPLWSLRSLAESGPSKIVLPIRYSSSPSYQIYIWTGGLTKDITLKIQDPMDNVIYRTSKLNQAGNEVSFLWDGRDIKSKIAPVGRYKLLVEATTERHNSPPEPRKLKVRFEHNPAWLQ
jgi:hypothetical protein